MLDQSAFLSLLTHFGADTEKNEAPIITKINRGLERGKR
jgi:hypothetical protein